MARQKGMLNLSGNLEPLAGAPLDSRDITPTVADLYIASNWPYKYIGMKTTVTATGDTYRLVNLDVTQESSWVKEGGESGQTIQYDELPAASSSLAGEIYQYTGTTNLQYTNGYFYECVNDGGTYKWVQTNTQPGTSYNDFTGATVQEAGAHGLVPAPTTGDISKFLKGDGTWAIVPMPSFDYSNTSPEAMNFSTDEKVIGTWIDGKPLYQKTVNCGALPNATTKTVPHNISNIDSICYAAGVAPRDDPSDATLILPSLRDVISGSTDQNAYIELDKTNVYITTHFDWASHTNNSYVTLRYTKTTDSVVASGEKIVGQWVDGKPIYQKTWEGLTPSSVDVNSELTDLTSWNIDKIVDMNGYYSDGSAQMAINYYFNEDNYTMTHIDSSKKLTMKVMWSTHINKPVHITLQYTKTT